MFLSSDVYSHSSRYLIKKSQNLSGDNLIQQTTHQTKIPRLCEAHLGALALQSAQVSERYTVMMMTASEPMRWISCVVTHRFLVDWQAQVRCAGSSLPETCSDWSYSCRVVVVVAVGSGSVRMPTPPTAFRPGKSLLQRVD